MDRGTGRRRSGSSSGRAAWRVSTLPTPESASESAPLVFSCGLSRVRLVRPTACLDVSTQAEVRACGAGDQNQSRTKQQRTYEYTWHAKPTRWAENDHN